MSEKPILFSGPMVRALLEGRKTQTRRVVKLPKNGALIYDTNDCFVDGPNQLFPEQYLHVAYRHKDEPDDGCRERVFSEYKVGMRLWVKETFRRWEDMFCYRADGAVETTKRPWKSSIFMPRVASRITLEITSVRVERLQEITVKDAHAEGCDGPTHDGFVSYRAQYMQLWDSLNAKRNNGIYAWRNNPWVWRIEFRPNGGANA